MKSEAEVKLAVEGTGDENVRRGVETDTGCTCDEDTRTLIMSKNKIKSVFRRRKGRIISNEFNQYYFGITDVS